MDLMLPRISDTCPADVKTGLAEEVVQNHIASMCMLFGLAHYHTRDSRGSDRGFLDSVCVGPGGIVIFETKDDTGTSTPEQDLWGWLFAQIAGVTVLVRRPKDTRNRPELDGRTQIQVDLEKISRGPDGQRFPKEVSAAIVRARNAEARRLITVMKKRIR